MKRRIFLKQLGLAASLPWLGRASLTAAEVPAVANQAAHRILTCNVRVVIAQDAKTGDAWTDRKDFCAEVIGAQKPDLIGLQECQEVHLTDLKSRLPQFESLGVAIPATPFHVSDAILYSRERYEVISYGGFWLSETPHIPGSKSWDSALPRMVNWLHLKDRKSGKDFRFWNTHLDHKGQQAREHSAALIVAAAAAYPADAPQIFTGDLNSGGKNRAIQIIREAGWRDTYAEIHGDKDPGFTAHAFLGEKQNPKDSKGGTKQKIDWIWCRGGVKTLAADIIRDSRNGHYPSDHYFVSATVTI